MFPIDNDINDHHNRYIHIGFDDMCQHFLLSKEVRTLSLADVLRLSEDEAYARFKAIRFSENGGDPFCPKCGCADVYEFKARKIFKCSACKSQFSLTSQTIFASRKLSIRDILSAIAIFMNGAKGHSALQLSRITPRPTQNAAVGQGYYGNKGPGRNGYGAGEDHRQSPNQ
jgi:ribosomal protein L37AE/L43A